MQEAQLDNRNQGILSGITPVVFFAYLLLSYPLFYFSYKFCFPDFGGQDFYSYYLLYDNWDFENTPSPFNMRIISSFFIFIMNKIGFHYDTEIVLTKFYSGPDQQVFFNAILFNYLCVVLTCLVLYRLVLRFCDNKVYAFMAGSMYLLGFGTLFFSLKPLSESCGILLLAIAFYYYVYRSSWIYLALFISLFQREYVFFVFGIVAVIDYYFKRDKYQIGVFVASVSLFAAYVLLRETLFYTPHFESQMSPALFWHSLLHPTIEWFPFIKQSLLLSNLLLLYLLLVIRKKIMKLHVNKNYLIVIAFLIIHVVLMSIMARFGNNAGRYFYYTAPILIFYFFIELKPLVASYIRFKDHV